ncbi:MAG TPA: hypothetical protein VFS59_08135 [Gemmatimonadaceae bacterium]|nr:hypothetical protein [Gemmatimonadaceae bacterium]
MFARRRFLVALLAVGAACAQSSSSASPEASTATTRVRKNPDIISEQELRDPTIAGTDAMTAIRQLRPAFFRNRGPQSFSNATAGQVQVSQDYGPLQSVNNLTAIDTRSLVEVRYLGANDAQARFGITANGGPVIVVLTTKSAQ